MICLICKDKVASIRLKEIINNEVTELDLCQACYDARENSGGGVIEPSTSALLSGLSIAGVKAPEEEEATSCLACGTSKADLREKGRLGCSDCYATFSVSLEPILSRIHGAVEHRGKLPHPAERNLDLKNELRRLQEELQDSVVSENYERAAKLRDQIKGYESM
jgi:protein arginine kinase activator